ncbi:MAG: hypothetical protein PHW79_04915 [Candidatus Marinimicrobia bacterium]|nr:hypothetical protein [Candidatus Neomarinimicrobiota bacterium]
MPILYQMNCHEKSLIRMAFDPLIHPEKIEGVIIGNDLDSLLSAALLKTRFGWDVAGFYDYTSLWFSSEMPNFKEKMLSGKYIAIDLDIFHPAIPSIGHHILEFQANTNNIGLREQQYSLNPNFIRGIDLKSFQRKYPLGTIHFLSWLLDCEPISDEAELLMWLADSSYINGQRFHDNVGEWINGFFKSRSLNKVFQEVDSMAFESRLREKILGKLEKIRGIEQTGQVRSRYLNITGFQCRWRDPNSDHGQIEDVLSLVGEITGWQIPVIPLQFCRLKGKRFSSRIEEIQKTHSSLEALLRQNRVFSYVIPTRQTVNYTTDLFIEKS